jgi:hypothetical protein
MALRNLFVAALVRSMPAANRRSVLVVLTVVLLLAVAASAQQITPHVGYVYPAGGRQGASFSVKVGGQFLDGVTNAYLSGAGVRAVVVEHIKPITQKQFNDLRERLQELQKKKKDAETLREIAEIRKKIATFVRRPASPAISEKVILQITLAPNAEPGERELRLGTPAGLSNPLVFCVGQLPELSERPAAKAVARRAGQAAKMGQAAARRAAQPEMNVTLPVVLNGQVQPGELDRYRFQGRQGQRVVVVVSARALIPYLADAVPGWFQASVTLRDAKGHELGFADHYLFHPDPVLCCEIPKDGEYVLEVRDSIYRGRDDFVYRITMGELPYLTSIFPLGGPTGMSAAVALQGWNLPTSTLTLDSNGREPGVHPLSVRKGEWISNGRPFLLDTLPECLEQEPNDTPQSAQAVTLPIIVNGRIGQPGDWDVFRFEGRGGSEIVAEVEARRLDSPLDSVLKLTDSTGRQLAFNDDYEDKGSGLNTHHADSYLRVRLPANGTYYLHLGDAQQQGGGDYGYRLRISPPRPDFELRVAPSSLNARAGASVPITVHVLRKDGCSNEIALFLMDAPAGFRLTGARVPANQDQVRLTLTVPPMPPDEPVRLRMEGRALIQGRTVSQAAVPAEDMMQAFSYRHLVPAQEMMVAVVGRWLPRAAVTVAGPSPVRIPAGGTARVRLEAPALLFADRLHLELSEPPDGITLQEFKPTRDGAELVLQCDAAKSKPGLEGNLIVSLFADRNNAAGKAGKAQANNRRAALGALPAIPFQIVKQ